MTAHYKPNSACHTEGPSATVMETCIPEEPQSPNPRDSALPAPPIPISRPSSAEKSDNPVFVVPKGQSARSDPVGRHWSQAPAWLPSLVLSLIQEYPRYTKLPKSSTEGLFSFGAADLPGCQLLPDAALRAMEQGEHVVDPRAWPRGEAKGEPSLAPGVPLWRETAQEATCAARRHRCIHQQPFLRAPGLLGALRVPSPQAGGRGGGRSRGWDLAPLQRADR
jgi:hypothetical protein